MPRPDIFLLTVDTLRADHLSCLRDDEYIATPNLDRLAQDGELYTNAMSCANQTVPSYAALLTGCYPSSLGIRVTSRLREDVLTLPELLKRQGYQTGCWTVAGAVGQENGIARGFDRYRLVSSNKFRTLSGADWVIRLHERLVKLQDRLPLARWLDNLLWRVTTLHKYWLEMNGRLGPSGGPVIVRELKEWCDTEPGSVFVLANFFDPHSPYHPPRRHWRRELTAREYLSVMKVNLDHWNNIIRSKTLREKDRSVLQRLYKSEVTYVDELIGEFLDYLRGSGRYDDALIVVLADHGESLGAHGLLGHWHALYEDLIHVPLMIKWPGGFRKGQVGSLVQNVDIFPTLIEYLQIEDGPAVEGISLLAPLPAGRLGIAEQLDNPVDIYENRPGFDRWQAAMSDFNYTAVALRKGSYKYIAYSDGRRELFDLAQDPDEIRDLADVDRERAAVFEQLIQETGRNAVLDNVMDWEEEVLLGHLAQLGYI